MRNAEVDVNRTFRGSPGEPRSKSQTPLRRYAILGRMRCGPRTAEAHAVQSIEKAGVHHAARGARAQCGRLRCTIGNPSVAPRSCSQANRRMHECGLAHFWACATVSIALEPSPVG